MVGNFTIREQQTLGEVPLLDLTNWQSPRYISGDSQIGSLIQITTPQGACHSIDVRNTVDSTSSKCPIGVVSSIVICPSTDVTTCPADATVACPTGSTISTTTYINMIATFTMGAAQNNVVVTFKYVENGIPKQEQVTVNVTSGLNHVYAFATNQSYPADTSLVLYGAEVLV